MLRELYRVGLNADDGFPKMVGFPNKPMGVFLLKMRAPNDVGMFLEGCCFLGGISFLN